MEIKRQIEVSKEVRENIEKVFGCSRMSVWRALSFTDHSEMSKRIRVYAIKNGGVTVVTAPECETIHDANGYMRQWFTNGACIEVDKNSGQLFLTKTSDFQNYFYPKYNVSRETFCIFLIEFACYNEIYCIFCAKCFP